MTIAYFNDTWWLVHGVAHLDSILSAQEKPELKIGLVACDSWAKILQMWDEPEEGQHPWAINPRIIERLKTRENTTIA